MLKETIDCFNKLDKLTKRVNQLEVVEREPLQVETPINSSEPLDKLTKEISELEIRVKALEGKIMNRFDHYRIPFFILWVAIMVGVLITVTR